MTSGESVDAPLIGLALAVGIGLLVGLQREWAEDKPVGLRSFGLIGALGGVTGLLSLQSDAGFMLIAAGLVGLALLLAAQMLRKEGEGMTTLVAALVVFTIGAIAVHGLWLQAIVLGGVVTLVLHWKTPMHGWVAHLGKQDVDVIARFVLLAAVILPVMPNRSYGPYDVFNPFSAWSLVVLIVAINLAGYVAFRRLNTSAGAWMAGLFGGLISSTATTISYATMSKDNERLGPAAALIILVASAVVYARILIELSVVSPGLVQHIAAPSVLFGALLLGLGFLLYFRKTRHIGAAVDLAEQENPARIRLALTFAALYVGILFAVALARDFIGEEAIYAVAFLSGLTDVDALTLTIGQSFSRGDTAASMAWRAIFLASLSNLLFKAAAASVLGSPSLRRYILGTGSVALLAGTAILIFWP